MFNLEEVLRGVKNLGISGHYHPDGDCCGSCLGLYNYIKDNFPETNVSVYLEEIPEVFKFLAGADKIIDPKDAKETEFDLYFALDCADAKRLADAYPLFKKAKKKICIDHHLSNGSFADENYIIPDYSSTCELVFNLLNQEKISKEVAECLYTGIVHDTGVFQYSCTEKSTMICAGILMEKGIDYPKIVESTYYEKTLVQNKLLGRALSKAELVDDGRVIATVLTNSDFKELGGKTADTEGIVAQLRITKDTDAAIFMYQYPDGRYKVSLRTSSDNINLSDIAVALGGGGHAKAAGCDVIGNPKDNIEKIVEMIKSEREKHANS